MALDPKLLHQLAIYCYDVLLDEFTQSGVEFLFEDQKHPASVTWKISKSGRTEIRGSKFSFPPKSLAKTLPKISLNSAFKKGIPLTEKDLPFLSLSLSIINKDSIKELSVDKFLKEDFSSPGRGAYFELANEKKTCWEIVFVQ
eukprot:TRINITY_DN1045_c1_g2_i2.p1 TRINITY_DN1045_c1_g2~~TRINITY_DN1045_c1_g2_i2.p1  ORF type:complete len:162 (-),score=53.55 TRINITY_DN1045_c1_g2_i2:228-656(-)